MKNLPAVILLVLTLPLNFAFAEDAEGWELRKDKEGIQVSTRKVEGSPILEYKARMVLNSPLEKVIHFYEQEKRMPEWFHNCTFSELVKDEGGGRKILYFALAMPWPVSDRDAVYLRAKSQDPAGKIIRYQISALPEERPKQEGKVRMPYLKGLWRFTPLESGGTEVFLQQHAEVGGHIPAVIVNRLVVEIPFNTLQNLRKALTQQ